MISFFFFFFFFLFFIKSLIALWQYNRSTMIRSSEMNPMHIMIYKILGDVGVIAE